MTRNELFRRRFLRGKQLKTALLSLALQPGKPLLPGPKRPAAAVAGAVLSQLAEGRRDELEAEDVAVPAIPLHAFSCCGKV